MLLDIHYYGDPILRRHCEPIVEITDAIICLVNDMIETMDKSNGIGLAAPQVGFPIRLFVLRNYVFNEDEKWTFSEPIVFINPKISIVGNGLVSDTEGCLSLPGIRLEITRPDKITVEATGLDGKVFYETLDDYNARVRMHENDHINGVLFIDRADLNARKKIEPELRALKQKYT